MTSAWKWWAGQDGEGFNLGPFDTRLEAITAGLDQWDGSFHVVEAAKASIEIAQYLDIDELLESLGETIEENHSDPDGGGDPLLDVNADAADSLAGMLRAEIQRWQETHGIVVTPWQFTTVRLSIFVEVKPR